MKTILLVASLFSMAALADDSNATFWNRAVSLYASATPVRLSDLPLHFSRNNAACVYREDTSLSPATVRLFQNQIFSFDQGSDPTLGLAYANVHWMDSRKRLTDESGELSNDGVTLRKVVNGATTSWILHSFTSDYDSGDWNTSGYESFETYCWVVAN